MNTSLSKSLFQSQNDQRLAELVDDYLNRFQQGEELSLEEFVTPYPDQADQLRQMIPTLLALEHLSPSPESTASKNPEGGFDRALGDYQILREVGRGGMGVVYEAEQISLGRRVALKVLPFAATMDPRHLQRFQNEARAAASLNHPHIVPVYGVGCERGVHYYAMQYIEGQTLAEIIHCMRNPDTSEILPGTKPIEKVSNPVDATTAFEPVPQAGVDTAPRMKSTTSPVKQDREYFHNIARLGIQAAEALVQAKSLGMVQWVIFPGNLMIDGRGELWITDFGLARSTADSGLTMTGDVLGTLRYMSPEQALAKHGLVDYRTDIYSLGVTLYELLTLKPAIEGEDRQIILQKIANEDPKTPRSINKAIPVDLETIVLKPMSKEPEGRYSSAKEIAEDLKRFAEDKPLVARRPTFAKKMLRWVRHHRVLVGWASLFIVLAFIMLAVSNYLIWLEKEGTKKALENEAKERVRAQKNEELLKVKEIELKRRIENAIEVALRYVDSEREKAKGGNYNSGTLAAMNHLVTVFEDAVITFPDRSNYQDQLSHCYGSLGDILKGMHRHQDAAQAYRKRIQTYQKYRKWETDFPSWALFVEKSSFTSDLAEALREAGDLKEAELLFQQVIATYEETEKKNPSPIFPWGRVEILVKLARVLAETSQFEDSKKKYQEAKLLLEGLLLARNQVNPPLILPIERELARLHIALGDLHWAEGCFKESKKYYQQASEFFTLLKNEKKHDFETCRLASWFYTTCPEKEFQNPKRALELLKNRGFGDHDPSYHQLLGIAHYRLGNINSAWEALQNTMEKTAPAEKVNMTIKSQAWNAEKTISHHPGSCATDCFFFAMTLKSKSKELAHIHQQHAVERALFFFQRGLDLMKKNNPHDLELKRFRHEAERVLGLQSKPSNSK